MPNFDTPLFTIDDVRLIRKVSVTIDDFDMYAVEVQRNYLSKLLGDRLYSALIDSSTDQRMVDLLDGVIYQDGRDVIFRGLKPYLSYLWLYLYSVDSSINHTPIGAMMFKDEFAEHASSQKAGNDARAHFISSADGMEESILRFLNRKISDYPEFHDSEQIEQAERDNITFKVIGKSYKSPNNFIG